MFLAEGGHAGQAGLGHIHPQANVTMQCGGGAQAPLLVPIPLAKPLTELLHHLAKHRVLLQIRSIGEGGPTLRAAEVALAALPTHFQALEAEIVATWHCHGAVEEAQADAAGQVLFQAEPRTVGHLSHGPAATAPLLTTTQARSERKTKLTLAPAPNAALPPSNHVPPKPLPPGNSQPRPSSSVANSRPVCLLRTGGKGAVQRR